MNAPGSVGQAETSRAAGAARAAAKPTPLDKASAVESMVSGLIPDARERKLCRAMLLRVGVCGRVEGRSGRKREVESSLQWESLLLLGDERELVI